MIRNSLLLTASLTAACAAILAQAAFAASGSSPAGHTVTTQDHRVSFWVPLTPKKTTGDFVYEGSKRRWTHYAINVREYGIFTKVTEISGSPQTGNEDSLLESNGKGFLESLGPGYVLDKLGGKTLLQLGPA